MKTTRYYERYLSLFHHFSCFLIFRPAARVSLCASCIRLSTTKGFRHTHAGQIVWLFDWLTPTQRPRSVVILELASVQVPVRAQFVDF